MIYINDSYQFSFNSYIKFPILVKFDAKFNKELKAFSTEIVKTFKTLKEKCSNFSYNDNSKITSEFDSNSGS